MYNINLRKITEHLTMVEENHVGGFLIEKDPATYMPKLWEYIIKTYNVNSILDIGCGMGHAIGEFSSHIPLNNITGVDGSTFVKENSTYSDNIIFHDFTSGELILEQEFDFGWCCEFVEHIEEKYKANFLSLFSKCKILAITYAEPGQEGHNHVNCQPKEYWINELALYGFKYDEQLTENLKVVTFADAISINPEYKDNHFYNRGLFFIKK
jgi:SAM-dependent methyltransferase